MSRDLIARLVDELDSHKSIACWSTDRDTCINPDCVARRALIAEAREYLAKVPVSAPPALDRRTSARPPAWGETQMQDGDYLPEVAAAVVDAELNGHTPTPWTEGGGYA